MAEGTILAMFSGGIDSSGILHRLFTDHSYTTRPLIIHHIVLQNRENRAAAELKAVKEIIDYYSTNYPDRPFTYTDSVINTSGFAALRTRRFPFDMDVCAFIAGNICVARDDIDIVAMGRTKTDIESGGESFKQRMMRAQKIFKSIHALESHRQAEYIFPVAELSKLEVWKMLPHEVQQSAWYCRRPNYDENGQALPCQECKTCKEVDMFKAD